MPIVGRGTAQPGHSLLIRGGGVITMNRDIGDLPSADVYVRDGVIIEIGADLDVPDAEIIDASSMIVMPGFVDGHRHMWEGVIRNELGNAEGFARECAEARDMGFDGKTLIHPSQIGPCNAAFSPSAEEVAQAKRIIAAFDLPENEHKGVVQLDGRMVERLHADMARRTVAIAEAIAARAA